MDTSCVVLCPRRDVLHPPSLAQACADALEWLEMLEHDISDFDRTEALVAAIVKERTEQRRIYLRALQPRIDVL